MGISEKATVAKIARRLLEEAEELAEGNKFWIAKALRAAARLATPPVGWEHENSRVLAVLIDLGEPASVAYVAHETGYSMRKAREALERVALPVAGSKDVFSL